MNRNFILHNRSCILAPFQGWCWWFIGGFCPHSHWGILSSFQLGSLPSARACLKLVTGWKVHSFSKTPAKKWCTGFKREFLWRKLGHVTSITKERLGNVVQPCVLHILLLRWKVETVASATVRWMFFFKRKSTSTTWVAQLVECLTLGFDSGHDLAVSWFRVPHWTLCWQCGAYLGFSLSLFLSPSLPPSLPPSVSASPPLRLCLSLSKPINTLLKNQL